MNRLIALVGSNAKVNINTYFQINKYIPFGKSFSKVMSI